MRQANIECLAVPLWVVETASKYAISDRPRGVLGKKLHSLM